MKEKYKNFEYSWNSFHNKFYVWHSNEFIAELFFNPSSDERLWVRFNNFKFNSGLIKTLLELMSKIEAEAGSMKSLAKVMKGIGEENDNSK